jgi:hypothetical protein
LDIADVDEWSGEGKLDMALQLTYCQGTKQSFSSNKYEDKIEHYLKENTYAQNLHPMYYSRNPMIKRICENIWSVDYFNKQN